MNGYDAVTVAALAISRLEGMPRIYKYTKAANHKGEYIVVNQLPFYQNGLQKSIINVNIHVPDLKHSNPDLSRIQEITPAVKGLFNHSLINGAYFDIDSESIYADADDTHYKNLRITVTHINL